MIVSGRVWKDGGTWIIECPTLGAVTEGRSKGHAFAMMIDWVQSMLDDPKFPVEIIADRKGTFSMTFAHPTPVLALMLAQARGASGMTLGDIAKKLGRKSRSTAKHYESGKHGPSLEKTQELLNAMGFDFEISVRKRA